MRELDWRAGALQMDAWDRAAWIALHAVAPYSKKQLRLEDLNPLRAAARQTDLLDTLNWAKSAAEALPHTLTEAERAARWAEVERKLAGT